MPLQAFSQTFLIGCPRCIARHSNNRNKEKMVLNLDFMLRENPRLSAIFLFSDHPLFCQCVGKSLIIAEIWDLSEKRNVPVAIFPMRP